MAVARAGCAHAAVVGGHQAGVGLGAREQPSQGLDLFPKIAATSTAIRRPDVIWGGPDGRRPMRKRAKRGAAEGTRLLGGGVEAGDKRGHGLWGSPQGAVEPAGRREREAAAHCQGAENPTAACQTASPTSCRVRQDWSGFRRVRASIRWVTRSWYCSCLGDPRCKSQPRGRALRTLGLRCRTEWWGRTRGRRRENRPGW